MQWSEGNQDPAHRAFLLGPQSEPLIVIAVNANSFMKFQSSWQNNNNIFIWFL